MTSFGEAFLERPDFFPARRAGEPWGEETVTVDLAGGPYRFVGLSATQAEAARGRFAELLLDASEVGEADATETRVFRADPREVREIDLVGWEYTFDRDYQPSAVRVAGLRFFARVDWLPPRSRPTLAAGLWTTEDDSAFFLSQLENFFRLLVAYRLLETGGVLLHSAGIASRAPGSDEPDEEVGRLFFGHSGAGKTTISRLARVDGRTVLSDDLNALSIDDGRPYIERLPFAGDFGRSPAPRRRWPLVSICRLHQGPNAIERLSPASAVARLTACAPFVNVDPHRADRLAENLEALVRGVGVHALTFEKTGGFWPLVDALSGRA